MRPHLFDDRQSQYYSLARSPGTRLPEQARHPRLLPRLSSTVWRLSAPLTYRVMREKTKTRRLPGYYTALAT